MTDAAAQTWHYGLVARWWAEFNLDGPGDRLLPSVRRGRAAGARRRVWDRAAARPISRAPGSTSTAATSRPTCSRSPVSEPSARASSRRASTHRRCTSSTFLAGTGRSWSAAASGSAAAASTMPKGSGGSTSISSPAARSCWTTRFRMPTPTCGRYGCATAVRSCHVRGARRVSGGSARTGRSTRSARESSPSTRSRST